MKRRGGGTDADDGPEARRTRAAEASPRAADGEAGAAVEGRPLTDEVQVVIGHHFCEFIGKVPNFE